MPLVAVCATNHPLANTSAPTLQQILSHTWITILAANDISLWDPDSIPRKIEVEQHELAIQLCLRGCGVFVGEQKQLAPYLKTGQLKIVDHKDAITTERLGLIYQKHWAASPALNSLIDLCKAHFS
jgi:DNA-binding transcriptional LysR family regulator